VINDEARLDRLASRDEIKEFYETYGNQWRAVLEMQFAKYVEQDLEDLI
jgi:PhoPQ-activated pathogenicity-related protein